MPVSLNIAFHCHFVATLQPCCPAASRPGGHVAPAVAAGGAVKPAGAGSAATAQPPGSSAAQPSAAAAGWRFSAAVS